MTQVYVIAGIIIIVSLMICYVFIRQTITKRKEEKLRLHRALEKRAKDLVQMLNAFPPNFLPRDLQIFLFRCIVDTYEQLSKLMPEEAEYLSQFQAYTGQMEEAMRGSKEYKEIALQSSSQINETRQYLNYLSRFMQKWMQRGNISQKQYGYYKDLVKKLITQLMVDNYSLSAKQAMQLEKPKLAIHYYMLAKNLLTKEGQIPSKKSRMVELNAEIEKLEKQIQKEEASQQPAKQEAEEAEDDKQWQQFDEDADWKKKNVYD